MSRCARHRRPPRAARAATALALLAIVAVLLAGCGEAAGASAGPRQPGAPISVVASTNVWGDIVATIGGPAVQVHSLIAGPPQDPHSFVPSPRDELRIARADLIIDNGGGYDDFMPRMISASRTTAPVITAVRSAGLKGPATGGAAGDDGGETAEFNEHIWYSVFDVARVADAITAELRRIEPARKATFDRNLAALRADLRDLDADVARLRAAHAGELVAVTEPVPLYLVQAAGLVNVTPEEFSDAMEEGNDIPARMLARMLRMISGASGGHIGALIYNSQTIGPQAQQIVDAAARAGIPAVPVTETLPPGEHYAGWMRSTIAAIATALQDRR